MALGLRHLVVVNEHSHVQGIITRKDLLSVQRAAGLLERDRARFYARRRLAASSG